MHATATTPPILAEARRTGAGVALQIDHAHAELEFNLIISGKGTYFLESGHHDLVPGTLVWLLPNRSHRLIRSPDLDMWVVTIGPDCIESDLLADVERHPCRRLSSADAVALDRQLSQLCQDADEPRLYQAGLAYALRSAWHLTVANAGPPLKPVHPAIIQAISILRSRVDTPTSAQLAKMCGITQDYLGRLLIEHTGCGFVEWRNRIRLERFLVIYPTSPDLLNAALDAGFGSYSQFHRVFSEVVGTSPGEWAKSGAQAKAIALPSETHSISGSSAESGRMIWYSLVEVVFAVAARWFTPVFAENISKPALPNLDIIASGIDDYEDLRSLTLDIVDQIRGDDSAVVERLTRALSRNDLIRYYLGTLALYGLDPADMTSFVTGYIAMAYMGARQAPTPSFDVIRCLDARVRSALTLSGTFAGTDKHQRKLVATALLIMSCALRAAMIGARASGDDAIVLRVSDAAYATARETLGLDMRSMDLEQRASVVHALAS